ncbi:DUF4157 domain-containing protein [Aquimarina sp. MMG016]|uniref:eCIS core domain-containing protein n=1 Tax=Aquimarina sp. MMG016 TaxID=2822690 RepID=UPI001B3A63DA|nr:DUF4157 domain-containing protein [Aquimarina sp. MMG016]MBQ4818574.1 DUF4157 domain-containing protein [Aquimarina sp. MMG016]
MQKKEEEIKETEESLQRKPIFESNAEPEPEIQSKLINAPSIQASKIADQSEEELQKKEEELEETEENIQTKSDDATKSASPDLESRLNDSKGGGSPLSSDTQESMGSAMGADFNDVRVHTGSNAVQMSKELGAQAFTHGSDIYFNQGKYDTNSTSGKHLLAHELTHTVQQGSSVQTKMIQKNGETTQTPSTGSTETTEDVVTPTHEYTHPEKGSINTQSKTLTVPNLSVPTFKAGFGPSTRFTIPKGGFPRNNNHLPEWERDAMTGGTFTRRFTSYAASSNAPNLSFNGEQIFYLVLKGGSRAQRREAGHQQEGDSGVIFGSIDTIKQRASRPYWDRRGQYIPHDVDHKREIQLGGAETDTSNMWMLESSANRSSGSHINNSKQRKVEELIRLGGPNLINPPSSYDDVKTNYDVVVENGVRADSSMDGTGNPRQNWEMDRIKDGHHLQGLKFLTESEVDAAGLRGSPDELLLFTNQTGGRPIRIPWDEQAQASGRKDGLNAPIGRRGGAMIIINTVTYNSTSGEGNQGGSGTIVCTAFPGSRGMIREKTNLAYDVRPIAGVSYGGYITRDSVLQAALHALEFKHLSPITLTEASLDDNIGLRARGQVMPSIPLLSDAGIELVIDEQGARLRKLFTKNDYNFPSPFEVTNSSLEVFAGTEGFGINGEMNFKINHVGEGFLRGNFSTEGGFALAGGFNFDSELFDPASIEVSYENEVLTVTGSIGIPEGKVRGVKSATITATYSENTFTATGEAELDIPGIQRGSMTATYNDEGFSIGGEFQLRDDVPGIRSGSVSATVSKQNGEEGYNVMVSGTAQPDIPGINSQLTITYDNGALTIEGSAAYSRGMLSGTVNVGATNRAIGDDGQPSGEPDDTMRVYGGGSLTLTLTPWLQATAGVKFLPNGEIEVTGRIGLPNTVDVFDRKSIDRNLFRAPAIEIPIFAIPLGPRSIGLVARITGGLDFSAGFGPGQLRELFAEVTYNPDREEETTIHGRGVFAIPADAGLTLSGDLGLGVSIGIASLTGGIEIAGTLGLEGEASAAVDVNWSPQTGLAIDAEGRVTVNPKFTFDINAFARASLDLWITEISETWRYNLASFSWGPDIQFGIVFPVRYREGEPFDMSFDDIEVIYPDLDIIDMAKGLATNVKDQIFD